ncbi:MAG: hypothetical protein HDQ87_05610 [Clostridia bacterium]|nr:hypothetical protein [Clostridia bacterium]
MKIFDLLNEILEELDRSTKQRFGARRTIDTEFIIDILQQIRQALPDEIVEAQKIIESRQRLMLQAHERADDIVTEAEEQVRDSVETHRVTKLAREKSEQLLQEARREAFEIRVAANDYAIEVLDDVSGYLSEYRAIIKENKTNFVNRMHRESEDL